MRMTFLRALAAWLATASAASAPASAAGGTAQGLIARMDMLYGGARLQTPTITDNPDGCPETGFYVVTLDHPNYQAVVASLIAAQHAGKLVFFHVDGCAMNYPKVVNAYVVS